MKKINAESGRAFFDKQHFASLLGQEKTAQEIWQVSSSRIEQIYQFACDLYEARRYEDACDLLLLLTALNPQQPSFWIGLGFACQQKADYAAAAVAYEYALALEPQNVELYPYYLKSLCEMGRKEQALVALKELMEKSPNGSTIQAQAENVMRSYLKGG